MFREYLAQLIEYEKSFIIWANNNAITYKEVFPLLKDNKIWLGYMANKTCIFGLSDDYPRWDEKISKEINDGRKYGKVPAISIFTNLDIKKRHEKLILWKDYSAEEFPEYDNYDAINVDKVAEIPKDYDGVMGVPITFLDKYNPKQFEIVGFFNNYKPETADVEAGQIYGEAVPVSSTKSLFRGPAVNGKAKYFRVLIRRKDI